MLMTVVEKMASMRYHDGDTLYPRTFGMRKANSNRYMVRFNRHPVFEADTLIEATWLGVVEFVEWYNDGIGSQFFKPVPVPEK